MSLIHIWFGLIVLNFFLSRFLLRKWYDKHNIFGLTILSILVIGYSFILLTPYNAIAVLIYTIIVSLMLGASYGFLISEYIIKKLRHGS